jgi:hypothetical protein
MYELIETRPDGDLYGDVPAWGNALDFLLDVLSLQVTRVAVPVFEDRVWHSAGPQMVEGPIVYFENAGGDELACWTVGINRLQVFNEPREVHPSMRSGKTLWTRPPVVVQPNQKAG